MTFFNSHAGGGRGGGGAAAAAAGILILTHHLLLSATAHPFPATTTINPALQGNVPLSAAFNNSDPTLLVPANAPPIPIPSTSPPLALVLAGLRPFAPPDPVLNVAVTTALSEALAYISLQPVNDMFPAAEKRFPAKQTVVRFSMANFLEDGDFTFGQAGKCVGVLLETLRERREWRRGGAWVRRMDEEGGEVGEVVTYMQLGSPDRAGEVLATT